VTRPLRAVLTAAAALLLVACPGDGEPGPTPPSPPSTEDRWLAAVDGLCGALTSAQEPEAAEAAFFDRSHDAIHEIAAAVQAEDTSAAAALLEAKTAVETDFETGAGPSRIEIDLQALIQATREALTVLGIESPGCA
jgi:hypothetical protein